MATKRKQSSDQFSPNKKHQSPNNLRGSQSSQPPLDLTYGQRGAFPGLDGDDVVGDGGSEEDSEMDALRYLKSVRLQATSIPTLLVAPKPLNPSSDPPNEDASLYADYPQGFYSDGAYTALPGPASFQPSSAQTSDDLDPQEAYYTALLTRFRTFQSTFRNAPAPPASSSTPQDHSAINALLRPKRSIWRGKLLKTTPTPQWLAALPHEMVMFGLEMLGEVLTAGNLRHRKYGMNLGVWVWGLLGRCRDVGQLGSEEVGTLRELGKQASWVSRRVVVGEVGEEVQEKEVEEEDEEGEVDEGKVNEREGYDVQDGMPQNRTKDYHVDGPKEGTQTKQAQAGAKSTHDNFHNRSNEIESSDSPLVIDTVRKPEADADPEALGAAQERLLSSLDATENAKSDPKAVRSQIDNQIMASHPDTAAHLNKPSQDCMQTKPDETPREDMLATLDTIITIIGESYGQRDLLDTRLLWDEINP